MPEVIFTTNGIQKLLEDLIPGKAAGPDNIPTWILKVCAVQIAPILQNNVYSNINSSTRNWFETPYVLLYINDIDTDICSSIYLFADDWSTVLNYQNT